MDRTNKRHNELFQYILENDMVEAGLAALRDVHGATDAESLAFPLEEEVEERVLCDEGIPHGHDAPLPYYTDDDEGPEDKHRLVPESVAAQATRIVNDAVLGVSARARGDAAQKQWYRATAWMRDRMNPLEGPLLTEDEIGVITAPAPPYSTRGRAMRPRVEYPEQVNAYDSTSQALGHWD